ncbi:MAG: hypothetical protein OXT67_05830 [Zetaproteobacteria bacterium]|nr:hypothetical protein [Zetaproteobacteria bacterium]
MKYLMVSADYDATGIRDNQGELDEVSLPLSEPLWRRIRQWVGDYQVIIPMNNAERQASMDLISELDERGVNICKDILSDFPGLKIEYYSEGLLKKLPF